MKNLFRIGGLLAFALAFTACEDDNESSLPAFLSVQELGSGSNGGAITINQGENLTFAWDARKGDSELDQFRVSVSGANTPNPLPTSTQGNDFPYTVSSDDENTYLDTLIFSSASVNLGVTNYTFSVVDFDGNVEEVSYAVTVQANTTPLSSAQAFQWERVGGNAGTGLAQFGLEWTSNSTTSAIVAVDAATKMVELSAADWTGITTQEDLAAAISNGTAVSEYRGVSSQANGTYDDVLGVNHNGVNYLLNIQEGTVSTGGSGTTITIDGEYKN